MCDHCGCSEPHSHHDPASPSKPGVVHAHAHDRDERRTVDVKRPVLEMNARLAERNRGYFLGKGVYALNLLSSPGSGKTTLIERTLADIGGKMKIGVIVGDLQTENDAQRVRSKGAPAIQITTGETCHLDAHMVAHALEQIDCDQLDVLFIENVGNLVCPASFDLGENARVVLLSTTEGEDKPLKYPVIFHDARLVLINKTDLAAAAGFDRQAALDNIRKVAPGAEILEISARTGAGMQAWYAFLEQAVDAASG